MKAPKANAKKNLTLELSIECADGNIAEMLNEVLMPDNRYFPKDQEFAVLRRGNVLTFRVASPRARPALSTASSVLSDAKLFQDVWLQTKQR
jgi:hypothetical protein